MKDELEIKLQQDFPFMKQNRVDNEIGTYKRWGCECSSGWYQLIHDLCQAISDRYASDNIEPDITVKQVKEKFGSLRFYYSFANADCPIQALDFLNSGISLRSRPHTDDVEDPIKNLHKDIGEIVDRYCEMSKSVCEYCGERGSLRTDLRWVLTLCEDCYSKHKENKRV